MSEVNASAFAFIADLRGGVPQQCDFCKQPYTGERYPIPEEAGEWACSECYDQWYGKDREMSNSVNAKFLAEAIAIENERINLEKRMKDAGLEKHQIAGTKQAAKLHFKDGEKLAKAREYKAQVEAYAEEVLGAFADTPLGRAAVERVSHLGA